MQGAFQRILTGTVFFTLSIVIAVVGYIWFGWTLLDAVYMVVITIFGVGYGEVQPLETPAQRIFTIFVILAGTTSAIYIVGGFVQMVTEGEINRALDANRKQRSIENLENHVIICGFGRIGQVLAKQLTETNQSFVVLDNHPDRIARAEERGYLARSGNATDEALLRAVGIAQAKVLATVLPDDATNVFITLTARELNSKLAILARGEFPATEKKLRLAGADHVVLPANVSGMRMANLIARPTTQGFLDQQDERNQLNDLLAHMDVQMDELTLSVDSPLVSKTVRELAIRGKGALIVVALRRTDGTTIVHPNQSVILNSGDTIIFMGHRSDIPQFARRYDLKHQLHYREAKV
ncbi:MAG: potassium channel protein [Cyanothece sp. SIO1E1]|nr:potassium channel protein [Cyanothece sp. SIO1E1]